MEIKEGLVGFFDILGYQDIIINDEIENTSVFVSNLFETLSEQVQNTLKSTLSAGDRIKDEIKWYMFSDTILINMPIVGVQYEFGPWQLFIMTTICLLRKMFKEGVPIRGGIAYGKYYISDKCIAGKPIIDAFKICQNQNWTGCCLSKSAEIEYEKYYNSDPETEWKEVAKLFMFKYDVPFKTSTEQLYTVNWPYPPDLADLLFPEKRYRQEILNSFTRNNKQIKPNVIDKVNNTEMYVSYSKLNILKNI